VHARLPCCSVAALLPSSRMRSALRCPYRSLRAAGKVLRLGGRRRQAGESRDASETTEKYGLEAGLWQVFTGKGASKDGRGRGAQAKDLLARYGSAYLLTSISFAIVSFGACYALVSSGAPRPGRRETLCVAGVCLCGVTVLECWPDCTPPQRCKGAGAQACGRGWVMRGKRSRPPCSVPREAVCRHGRSASARCASQNRLRLGAVRRRAEPACGAARRERGGAAAARGPERVRHQRARGHGGHRIRGAQGAVAHPLPAHGRADASGCAVAGPQGQGRGGHRCFVAALASSTVFVRSTFVMGSPFLYSSVWSLSFAAVHAPKLVGLAGNVRDASLHCSCE